MERELWPLLYHALRTVAKDFHQKYVSYQPWVLVAVLLWAALHDRPLSWACQTRHGSTTKLRPFRLPSPSVLSRRLDGLAVGAFLHALEQYLRNRPQRSLLAFLDGKALPVSGVSKDKDAGFGRGAGCKAKGYKWHTLWANRVMPEAWEMTALNESETKVAEQMLRQTPGVGYVLGDGNYDANAVFDAAGASGYQWLTPMPAAHAGKGHHYQSPYRLGCIERMRSDFGKTLYASRSGIERRYGHAVSFGGGVESPASLDTGAGAGANLGLGQTPDQCDATAEKSWTYDLKCKMFSRAGLRGTNFLTTSPERQRRVLAARRWRSGLVIHSVRGSNEKIPGCRKRRTHPCSCSLELFLDTLLASASVIIRGVFPIRMNLASREPHHEIILVVRRPGGARSDAAGAGG